MEPGEKQTLDVEAAIERLSKVSPQAGAAAAKVDPAAVKTAAPSKLNPKNWPAPVKTALIAAITAGLVAAKVPMAIVTVITSLLFGG